ncbi:hypothetical protein [Levilactobacillus enshiensis]|nr:hypothetical protein [Levilactobacillus enshiensis]
MYEDQEDQEEDEKEAQITREEFAYLWAIGHGDFWTDDKGVDHPYE